MNETNLIPDEAHTAAPPGASRYLVGPVGAMLASLPKRARVLDVGCGNGWWAGWLAEQGHYVVGIDPSRNGIAIAQQLHPNCRFMIAAAQENLLELLDEPPFDAVISLEIVEHVYSPRTWAAACFEALKPGGRLVCSTPYHGYWKNLAMSLLNGWDKHLGPLQEGGHIKFWSVRTITKLLTDAGFGGICWRGAGRFPGLWRSMVVAANRRR